jgi:hypothetical protein
MALTFDGPGYLAPAGSTGNNTHPSFHAGSDYSALIVQFVVEATGATPTVTWKVQGSLDNVDFFDLAYITDATDTLSVATRTVTSVSKQVNFLANPGARRYKYYRLVTSANTNVTYRGEIYLAD